MTITQPLRAEYAELVPHIAALAAAGDAVDHVSLAQLRALVDGCYAFLHDELRCHSTTSWPTV